MRTAGAERLAMVSRPAVKSIQISYRLAICHSSSMSLLDENELFAVAENPPWQLENFWNGTRAGLGSATGLAPASYTSDAFFRDEQRLVFERGWVCVGLAEEAKPGRVLVRSLGKRSILITTDEDGTVYGHLNSCRHRGTELYECDSEVRNTLRCPYHRWGYNLDGSLKSTPRFNEVPRDEFDPTEFSLVSVRVQKWGVLLFACLDDETMPLEQWLGDLDIRFDGYDLRSWLIRDEQVVNIESNWKLISENFQEYYHLAWVHPELAKVSKVEDHYRFQGPGMYCGQTTTPVSSGDGNEWLLLPPQRGLDGTDAVSGRFIAIFPNVLLSVLPNHIFVMRLDPLKPGITQETCSWLLPHENADATDEAFEPTKQFWLDVNAEDIDIVERGQRGLTGGAVPAGPLSPRFEEPLHRFHNMLADLMMKPIGTVTAPVGD